MLLGVVITFTSSILFARVKPFNCLISVIPLSLKNFWIFVLKQHDLKNLFLNSTIPFSLYLSMSETSIKLCPSKMLLEIVATS